MLSKLPAELRNEIYRLVLVDDEPLDIERNAIAERTALLKACRQTREEASEIFYAENKFRLPGLCTHTADTITFLELAGQKNASGIPRLIVAFPLNKEWDTILRRTWYLADEDDWTTLCEVRSVFCEFVTRLQTDAGDLELSMKRLNVSDNIVSIEKREVEEIDPS